ncbi:hypothetical protein KUTeg_007680 [Tegillarca granosa]|uniref:Mitochondrial transcription rescue factor 1 C-terminal domain-containing protein n=1 Tax=Tegillarca granosa TaxID=220873 RepID=A0ABQ9FDY9_TEGGR|nr:hypothetical protein KUTeg_007680 [Tegillarca granosa]
MQICLLHFLITGLSDDAFLKQQCHRKDIRRYKKRKHPKEEESEDESSSESGDDLSDSESDADEEETFPIYPEDSHIKSPYSDKVKTVTTTRCDAILRKALNLKANEVINTFFAGNIYVNDKKIMKKNVQVGLY